FRSLALEDHWRALPLFTIRGIQAVTAVSVFGLFVYHHIGGTMNVGAARALDSLGFVATGLVAGRLVERYGSVPVLLFGTFVAGTMHVLRGFLVTPVQAFLLSLVAGIFFQIYHVPLFAWFADRAEEHDSLEFYTLRKIFVSLGNVITITTLVIGLILLPQKQAFMATFGVAALSTVAMGVWYWQVAGDM
ncbi:MAG: hypothetical protein SVU32_04365, partial [Candidatus Nanohaloarchaea archaeon]|nr:hypothetical protein [Candidatus Nanohaloarchaea archaeon]